MYINLLQRIKENTARLKGKQYDLARYLETNYKNAAFMNSSCLAKNAGVSEATLNRFANILGYTGFTHLINDLRDYIQGELTTLDRIEEKVGSKSNSILEKVLSEEQNGLLRLPDYVKQDEIDELVREIYQAKRIIITGFQVSRCLAEYFGYTLSKVTGKVQILTEFSAVTHAMINSADHQTLVIAVGYPRYPNAIIGLCEQFAEKGALVISITDSMLSPIIGCAKRSFRIPINYVSTIDQLGPVLAFIQTVVLEYNQKYEENSKKNLAEFEHFVDRNNVFYKIDK